MVERELRATGIDDAQVFEAMLRAPGHESFGFACGPLV
jgi:hypothetical protein